MSVLPTLLANLSLYSSKRSNNWPRCWTVNLSSTIISPPSLSTSPISGSWNCSTSYSSSTITTFTVASFSLSFHSFNKLMCRQVIRWLKSISEFVSFTFLKTVDGPFQLHNKLLLLSGNNVKTRWPAANDLWRLFLSRSTCMFVCKFRTLLQSIPQV